MWHFRIWFIRHGGVGLMVGLMIFEVFSNLCFYDTSKDFLNQYNFEGGKNVY